MPAVPPRVTFGLPDGSTCTVGPGAIVGRLPGAAIRLSDPAISEAHALVSLRGGRLVLVALRGGLAIHGRRVEEVALEAGQAVQLSRHASLAVRGVELPDMVLALAGLTPDPLVLLSAEASLVLAPSPVLLPGVQPQAALVCWCDGEGWWGRAGDGPAEPLVAGAVLKLGAAEVGVVELPARKGGAAPTASRGRFFPPMRVRVDFESTRVDAEGGRSLVILGRGADLLYQLVDFAVATEWALLAKAIWRREDDEVRLRWKFEKAVKDVRDELTAAGLRADLVASQGGRYFLNLAEGDALEDATK